MFFKFRSHYLNAMNLFYFIAHPHSLIFFKNLPNQQFKHYHCLAHTFVHFCHKWESFWFGADVFAINPISVLRLLTIKI